MKKIRNSYIERFLKTGRFNISSDTIDNINEFYIHGRSIDLNEEVYNLISDFVTFFKPRNVLDPHCGIGTVLNSIKNNNKVGYEKNTIAVEIAQEININSSIKLGDIYKENLTEKFDLIISFIPFFGYADNIKNIFYLIKQNLNNNGNLILILPAGFFWSQSKQLKEVRSKLIKSLNVTHIIDLPPSYNTGVKLKMLVVNKSTLKSDELVYMPRLTGFIKSTSIKNLKKQDIVHDTISKSGNFWVKKEELILSSIWERRFHDPIVKDLEKELKDSNARKLIDITDLILAGKYVSNNFRKHEGEILVITPRNIQNNNFTLSSKDYYINSDKIANYQKFAVLKGDIILNSIGPNFKFCIIPKNIKAIINQNIFLIRSKNNHFIIQYLSTNAGLEEFLKQTKKHSRGIVIPKLYLSGLKNILVPVFSKPKTKFEIAGIYYESDTLKLLLNEFTERGWGAEIVTSSRYKFDIGLYHNSKLISFVEIKKNRNKINNIDLEKLVTKQVDTIVKYYDLNGCFVIIDSKIYFYYQNKLKKLNSLPIFSDYKKTLNIDDYPSVRKQKSSKKSFSKRGREQEIVPQIDYKKILDENDYERPELSIRYLLEKVTNLVDIVEKQNMNLEKLTKDISVLKEGQKSIKSDTKIIPELAKKLDIMMSEVKKIKSLTKHTNESIDHSILKIIKSVDKTHDFNKIDDYIPKVTEWFKFWHKIEKNTKTFMPGSEWLYDNIKISEFQDFSPFVLYYCRALENELLKKIFLSFHDHVNKMSEKKFKSLFIWNKDGLNEKKLKEYQVFFNQFKTNIIKKREKYTLGDMRLILNLLPNSKNKKGSTRFSISPLLKELNKFISNKIGQVEPETIKRLEDLITNYRNKSAHVEIIDEEKALVFYQEFKIIMNKLIGKF